MFRGDGSVCHVWFSSLCESNCYFPNWHSGSVCTGTQTLKADFTSVWPLLPGIQQALTKILLPSADYCILVSVWTLSP